jgi:hypothetical protein
MHILPRLPRLNRITGLGQEVTENLFGGVGGMAEVAKLKNRWSSSENDDRIWAWRKFKMIAMKIKHWELELESEEVEALFAIDPSIKSNALTLSLSTCTGEGFPIMESESSQVPVVLSELPHLTSLTISRAQYTEDGQLEYVNTLSQLAISISYPFASTLTSFTWLAAQEYGSIDVDFIRFLPRFTSLRHLRLQASSIESSGTSNSAQDLELPEVTHLDLAQTDLDDGLEGILSLVSFPKLAHLTIEFLSDDDGTDWRRRWRKLRQLQLKLDPCKNTLRHVYLLGSASGQHCGDLINELLPRRPPPDQSGPPPYAVHIDWQPGLPEARVLSGRRFGFSEDTEAMLQRGLVDGIGQTIRYLMDQYDSLVRTGDQQRARELVKAVTPVWELKKWYED